MEAVLFRALLRNARAGDSQSAASLIREHEPALRRQVRMCLTNPWVKRVLDVSDIVQSVLGNFFIRLAAGQFELDHPDQMVKLLSKMAVNKILNYTRDEHPERRQAGAFSQVGLSSIIGPTRDVSEIVADKEVLEKIDQLLTEAERVIVQRRNQGLSWQQVAEELGSSPEALRKQHERALNRVAQQLNVDEFDE